MWHLRLKTKFTIGFGLILLLTVFLGGTAYIEFRSFLQDTTAISKENLPQVDLAAQLQNNLSTTQQSYRAFLDDPTEEQLSSMRAAGEKLTESFAALQSFSARYPQLTDLATLLSQNKTLIDDYVALIEKSAARQEALNKQSALLSFTSDSLEKALKDLVGSFVSEINSSLYMGTTEKAARLISVQQSVSLLKEQVELVGRQVQEAVVTRSSEKALQQLRRIPELKSRVERLDQFTHVLNREQNEILQSAKGDVTHYLTYLNNVYTAFTEQTQAFDQQQAIYTNLLTLTRQLSEASLIDISKKMNTANSNISMTIDSMNVLMAVIVMLIVVLAVLTTRTATVPIREGLRFAESVAQGNFDARWHTKSTDEMKLFADSLNTAFTKVAEQGYWFESILNSVPLSVSVTDMDMNWTFMNTTGLNALGYKAFAEIEGKHCSEKRGDLCNTPYCGIEQLRQGNHEVKFKGATGRTTHVMLDYLLNKDGNRIGHIEIGRDITEEEAFRKKAEEALKRGRHETASGLENVTAVINNASQDLSAQIIQCDRGMESASGQLSSTACAMEEMNASVLEVAQNSANAAELSLQAKDLAQEGSSNVNNLVARMNELHEKSLAIRNDMQQLGTDANNISDIMRVISDIAEQTNLLALNAAIEAARAGDAGRGFAVVADEVRKLAEKTTTSTTDVGHAIKNIQTSAHKNVENVEQTAHLIEFLTELAQQSEQSLQHIVQTVESTADQIRAIATASEEQSATSDEITRAIGDVSRVSQETSNAMRVASTSINQLVEQTQVLKKHIEGLLA